MRSAVGCLTVSANCLTSCVFGIQVCRAWFAPSGLPPPLVLVDDGVILGLQDRIRGLLLKLAAMQQEAQYQVCLLRAAQVIQQQLDQEAHVQQAYMNGTWFCQPGCAGLKVMRQTQALKESLSMSSSQVSTLTGELEQLRAELERCRQKAVTDQEQARQQAWQQQLGWCKQSAVSA